MFKNSAIGMPVGKYSQNLGKLAYKYIQTFGMAVGLMPTGMPVGKYIQNPA
jgi:hypothetical protein